MTHAVADIRWLGPADGGRANPVTGRRYMSPILVEGEPWTLVVDRSDPEPRAAETVLVHFLVPSAPHSSLRPGWAFQLLEGARVVADGTVSEVYDLNPAAWSGGEETAA